MIKLFVIAGPTRNLSAGAGLRLKAAMTGEIA